MENQQNNRLRKPKENWICSRCQGTGKSPHTQTGEIINCHKCNGRGFVSFSHMPTEVLNIARDSMGHARNRKDILFLKREVIKLRESINDYNEHLRIQDLRNKQILMFLEQILVLYNHSLKNGVKVRMQKLMSWMSSLIDEDQWKALKELEAKTNDNNTEEQQQKEEPVDLVEELLNKQDLG